MTASDLDIWRAASQVIKQHGVGAWIYAAQMSREFEAKGDALAAVMWRQIAGRIAELEDVGVKTKLN